MINSRDDLIRELRDVADRMERIGAAMDYYGGFDDTIAGHGKEIFGAAGIARGWADGMEREIYEQQKTNG